MRSIVVVDVVVVVDMVVVVFLCVCMCVCSCVCVRVCVYVRPFTFWLVNVSLFRLCIQPDIRHQFLDASTHLYMRVCPAVGCSVGRLISPSVQP